jgi:hypothetical protein
MAYFEHIKAILININQKIMALICYSQKNLLFLQS